MSRSLEAESAIRVLADPVSGESPSWCAEGRLLTVSSRGQERDLGSLPLLTKTPIPGTPLAVSG